ncbi:MAG: M48 family metalloprotease [Planctomycetes bacterium]|nr:M48 family metalloprotease [Planctomycetota bacterium]
MRECSMRLDIPVPSLFIESSPVVNAYTIATDDRAPFVVLSAGCADTMSEDELLFVLGHECGHVHNLHGVYNLMAVLAGEAALLPAASLFAVFASLLSLIRQGMSLGIAAWSRCRDHVRPGRRRLRARPKLPRYCTR